MTVEIATFGAMQQAELEFWRNWSFVPSARERAYALYGSRYLQVFADEFNSVVDLAVEIGSGPLPVAAITGARNWVAIDTLAEPYMAEGLATDAIIESTALLSPGIADLVLLLNVLDHTPDPLSLVEEAMTLLKGGGLLLLWTHTHAEASPDGRHLAVDVPAIRAAIERHGSIRRVEVIDGYAIRDADAWAAVAVAA